jgi:hypothetical protein
VLSACFSSCKKDKLLTDSSAKVDFSADSVLFDTVFTTVGSATRNIRVINNHDQKIKISSIHLQQSNSQFILNVDGAKGNSFSDIEIAAHDSLFIFIQVNVNPTNLNSPLIISDAIQFNVNGNQQNVYLEAWGQDAYYHKPTNAIKFVNGGYLAYTLIAPGTNTTVTWNNDKPHVIYGWLVVDSTQTLIINPGVKVHFHQNAGLWVYRYGTLKVKGAIGNEVVFQGDRLEPYMQDIPGQWDRIWINEGSVNNEIDYAIIKNGFIGVQADLFSLDFSEPRRLKITNTVIRNMSKWGLYGLGAYIYGGNNVISNCKEYCGYFILGGRYRFIHTTFANYWTNDSRTTPCVLVNNHTDVQTLPLDTCYFGNCIIYGNRSGELSLDFNTSTQPLNYTFSNCVIRSDLSNNGTNYLDNRFNTDPGFTDPVIYNFELGNSAAATNFTTTGSLNNAALFPYDIKNKGRTSAAGGDNFPDAGAIEK